MNSLYSILFISCISSALTPLYGQQEALSLTFEEWLLELRLEAAGNGISEITLASLDSIEPLKRVLELDNSQPEFVQTFTRYIGLRITKNQVARGQALLAEHSELLEEVRQQHGVQPHYLTAFWAIESNFGRATGGFSVLQALATLAYDPRRASFFRAELLTALQIIDDGHISSDQMSGSWAGAMGQLQFLPSVFYRYGVDGDGDGRIDIWNSLPDVFHSAANFLSNSGWQGDERWGREVLLPSDFDYALAGTETRKSLQQWRDLGISGVNGEALPVADIQASVVLPAGAGGPAFLGYSNYRVTLAYNPSTFYALTVGNLGDRFTGGQPIQRMPINEQAMSLLDVFELQELLNANGFDSGEPDGRIGRMTRGAVRAYQNENDIPMDGYASASLLQALRN
jgi:membrane-bound lytic murein transglycosylase B